MYGWKPEYVATLTVPDIIAYLAGPNFDASPQADNMKVGLIAKELSKMGDGKSIKLDKILGL